MKLFKKSIKINKTHIQLAKIDNFLYTQRCIFNEGDIK